MSLRQSALIDSLYCLKNAIPQFIILTLSMVYLQYLIYSIFFSQHDLFNTTLSSFWQNYFTFDLRSLSNFQDDQYFMSKEVEDQFVLMFIDIIKFQFVFLFTELLIKSSIISGTLAIIYCLTNHDKTEPLLIVKKTVCYLPIILLINFIVNIFIIIGFWLFVLPGVFFLYAFQLVPIIKIVDQSSLSQALVRSVKIMFKNTFKLLPILLGLLLLNSVILSLALSIMTIDTTLFFIGQIVLVVNTGFTIFLNIYLLRFYILITQKNKA